MLNFNQYQTLTFDCYGTLIDWESGILTVLKPLLLEYDIDLDNQQILQNFAEFEAEIQQGEYIKYREVLQRVVQKFGERFGFVPSLAAQELLADSIQHWLPFPDTVTALQSLKQKYQLVIISNVDDDLFAGTAKHLKVEFDQIITAEQVKSYKPDTNNFQVAIERINLPLGQILHVAASVYHDIITAKSLGLSTVWVNRRGDTNLAAIAQPDLEVPDLQTLADLSL